MAIKIRRAYEPAKRNDGLRVLVDRLWPRGVSKRSARIDLWLKEIAPTTALRKWFGHDPAKWPAFRNRYFQELNKHSQAISELRERARHKRVTLVYAAKDESHNNAVALKEFIESPRRHS